MVDFSIIENEFLEGSKKRLQYLKGENLFKQGAFAPYIMFVRSGLVKVYLQTGHQKQVNLRIAKHGDFLAFASVFGEEVYTYSAVALKDSEVCMIEKEQLRQLLYKDNDFAMHVTSANYKNEKYLLEVIASMSYKQMRGKLATALLYLSGDDFINEDVFSYLTRQDIADFATISTESAIKFIKEFEKEDILSLDGKNIVINDHKKLELIALNG